MAITTVWKPIETMPRETLVIVYDSFQGYGIRSLSESGHLYDEHGSYDDSGIDFELWADLPDRPGPRSE